MSDGIEGWFAQLRNEIYQGMSMYKSLYCHRAKFANLCQQLNNYIKVISHHKFAPERPTPHQAKCLQSLLKYIRDFRQVILYLDTQHFVEFIASTEANYILDFLKNFREKFSRASSNFPWLPNPALPENPGQLEIDDKADITEILQHLNQYLPVIQDQGLKAQIMQKMNDYQQVYNQYKATQTNAEDPNRVLSESEIKERLQVDPKFFLSKEEFRVQKKIGSGGFADVFLGVHKKTNKLVAIKILHNNEITESLFKSFKREIEIQSLFDNFAIVPLVGVCTEPPFYIVTEYIPKDSLFKRLKTEPKLTPTQKTIMALGCALGIEAIHKKNMIHRDIKSLNVLIDADEYPKLCDFGLARDIPKDNQVMTGCIGTAQWEAPEVLNNEAYSEKADVYAYGVMLWEILTNDCPFRGMQQMQVAMGVVGNGLRPRIPANTPPKIAKLIQTCWDQDPKKRPSISKVVSAFASGKIMFPGTKQNDVRAYLSRFENIEEPMPMTSTRKVRVAIPPTVGFIQPKQQPEIAQQQPQEEEPEQEQEQEQESQTKRIELDSHTPSPTTLAHVISNFSRDLDYALDFILNIVSNVDWVRVISTSPLISSLLIVLQETSSSIVFEKITRILVLLAQYDFIEPTFVVPVIEAFANIGNTSMVDIPVIIHYGIAKGIKFTINKDLINKLAAFIQSVNMTSRQKAIDIFYSIISSGEVAPEMFAPIVKPAIENLVADSTLLEATVQLLYALVVKCHLVQDFIDGSGIISVVSLIASSDDATAQLKDQTKSILYEIFQHACSGKIDEEMLVRIADSLSTIIPAISNKKSNEEEERKSKNNLAKFLAGTAYAFRGEVPREILEKYATFVIACLEKSGNPRVILVALKIIYHYLRQNSTRDLFFHASYASFLRVPVPAISIMAANCLIEIIPNLSAEEDLIALITEDVYNFLVGSLSVESEATRTGLRLFGVFALTFIGAKFLEENSISQLAGNFMVSTTPEIRKLGFQAFAAFISTWPISSTAIDATIAALQALTDPRLAPYPLIILSSICVCPTASSVIAKNISYLVSQVRVQDELQKRLAIKTLTEVFGTLEAREYFKDHETLAALFNSAPSFVNKPSFWPFIELVDVATGTVSGLEAVKETQGTLLPILNNLLTSKISKKNKWHINRILIRINVQIE